MDLLSIPIELRLHIYTYVMTVSPLRVDLKNYTGLLCSCMTVRDGIEPELCKSIAKDAVRIAANICKDGGYNIYTSPKSFDGRRDLTVSRPKTIRMLTKEDLFFDTFTVTFYSSFSQIP